MSYAVSHSLNQNRPVLTTANLPGFFGGIVNGKHVVPVHPNRGHTIRWTPDGDPVTPILLVTGRGDGIPIIAAEKLKFEFFFGIHFIYSRILPEKYNRAVKSCSEVKRSVSVSFAGRALAKVHYHDEAVLRPLERVRRAHSLKI